MDSVLPVVGPEDRLGDMDVETGVGIFFVGTVGSLNASFPEPAVDGGDTGLFFGRIRSLA